MAAIQTKQLPINALNDGITRLSGALSRAFNTAKDTAQSRAQKIAQSPAAKAFTRAAAGAGATIAFKSACVGAACSAGASAAVGGAAAGLTITGYQAIKEYRASERERPKSAWATIKDFFGFLKEDDNAKKYTKKLVMNSGAAALGGFALIEFFSQAAHGDDILEELQSHQRPASPPPAQTQSIQLAAIEPPVAVHQHFEQEFKTNIYQPAPAIPPPAAVSAPAVIETPGPAEAQPEQQPLQPEPSALDKLAKLDPDEFSGRAADTLAYAIKEQDWAIKEIAINLLSENNGSPLNRELAVELLQIAEGSTNAQIADQASRDLGIIQDLWPEAYAAATQEKAVSAIAETAHSTPQTHIVESPSAVSEPETLISTQTQAELPEPKQPGENAALNCVSRTSLDEIELKCTLNTENIVAADTFHPNISDAAEFEIFHDPSSVIEEFTQEEITSTAQEQRPPLLVRFFNGLKEFFVPGSANASEHMTSIASSSEAMQPQTPCNVSRDPSLPNLANLHCTFNGQNMYTSAAYGFNEPFALKYSPTPETLARAPSLNTNMPQISAL